MCLPCLDIIRDAKLKKSACALYKTQYHIVCITRYRKKILVKDGKKYLRVNLQEIRKYYPDRKFIEIGIDCDHVYLYMLIPPKYSVRNALETIKKNIIKSLREKFGFLKNVYWDGKGIWGKGYFVSTVGINEEIIKKYIEMQEKENAGQAQLEL